MRLVHAALTLAALGMAALLFQGSFSVFKSREIDKATARLTLYQSTLEAELRRFAHLPFLLSLDPLVSAALAGGDTDALDHRLARFSDSAGIDAIYLMDNTGLTISASNAQSPSSFKGQNYGFRPYFREALAGKLGEFYGIGATTGQPGYFYAIAVLDPAGDMAGVIAIKIDLSDLQDTWQASGVRIILANADGVALLASDPDWRYKALDPLSGQQRVGILRTRQFANEALDPLNWNINPARQTARIDGDTLLYLRTGDLPNDWSLHFFVPDDQAVTRAWLTTGTFMGLILLGFLGFQLARVRRMGAALKRSETEEALLREANEKLAVEIDERRAAQRNLQKTQAELERAGRLAALGQLASSVTHELGQPIAAMRNHLAAAEITSGASPLQDKMQGLVDRMESITRQLKFFSRKGRDRFEVVDLRDVLADALELLEPAIELTGADIQFSKGKDRIRTRANRLRIEQVMTNVIRNALDAVEDAENRQIAISVGQTDSSVWFTVADTGHGLGGKSLEDLREPFATTRESGRGMGLGLTISAGIVSDHDGQISARDLPAGGTEFRIQLPKPEENVPS